MTDAVRTEAQDAQSSGEAEAPTFVQEIVEIAKTVAYALLIALVLRVFLFQPFTIPSDSMEPNLLHGDYIIVSKWSYGYSRHSIPLSPPLFKGRILGAEPKRGDIIVFKLPADNKTDYIKRLIGLPGDRIQVRGGVLYVNEKPVPRVQMTRNDLLDMDRLRQQETSLDSKRYVTYGGAPYGYVNNTGVFLVPQGHYFFMGDNRDNSLDSRVEPNFANPRQGGVGFVPAENLVGKAEIILLSWYPPAGPYDIDQGHEGASLFKPWTWFTEARPSRFFNLLK
ncbi:MAG: signal peptidase I [Caulobacter sp.]|nr:signal peptidase I [Caulobacter sp.]